MSTVGDATRGAVSVPGEEHHDGATLAVVLMLLGVFAFTAPVASL